MPNYTRKATVCSVEGCTKGGYIVRGLCKTHYARLRRRADPGGPELLHSVSNAGRTCTVDGCALPVMSKALCNRHYKRWYKYGDPTFIPKRPSPEERFAAYIQAGGDGCHEWSGPLQAGGYGWFRIGRRVRVLAHRYAYEMARGPIPDGLVIDHLCRNRRCVNPEHMEPVTNMENLRRGLGYGLANGLRTTCTHGHEYTPENTYINPQHPTSRRCRTCARERDRTRKAS